MFQSKHTRQKKRFNQGGFTLIEMMIAISIFAIGFLAIASLMVAAGKANRTGSEITEAVTIAADRMEWLMNLSFEDGELDPAANPHVDNQGKYNIQWLITETDLNTDGSNDAKIVNMSVSWNRLTSAAGRSVNIDFIKPDM